MKGRIFRLMGYRIVEGELRSGRIHDLRRIDLTPKIARTGDFRHAVRTIFGTCTYADASQLQLREFDSNFLLRRARAGYGG
jgi:hypothetical protein